MSTQSKKLNVLIVGSGSHVSGFVTEGFRNLARQTGIDISIYGYDIREDADKIHNKLNIEGKKPEEFLAEVLSKGNGKGNEKSYNLIIVATKEHLTPVQQMIDWLQQRLQENNVEENEQGEPQRRLLVCVEKPTFPTQEDYENVLQELQELNELGYKKVGLQVGLYPMHHAKHTPTYEALRRLLTQQREEAAEYHGEETRPTRILVCRADPYYTEGRVLPHAPNEDPLHDSGPNILMEIEQLTRQFGLKVDWDNARAEGRYRNGQQTAFAFKTEATEIGSNNTIPIEGYTDWALKNQMNTKFSVIELDNGTKLILVHTMGDREGTWASLTMLAQDEKGRVTELGRFEGNRMAMEYTEMANDIFGILNEEDWAEKLGINNNLGIKIVGTTQKLSENHNAITDGSEGEEGHSKPQGTGLLKEIEGRVEEVIATVEAYMLEDREDREGNEGFRSLEGTKEGLI